MTYKYPLILYTRDKKNVHNVLLYYSFCITYKQVMDETLRTDDSKVFPENFFDIGGKRFDWVFEHKPVFVKFTTDEMKRCSGFILIWQNYCRSKIKDAGPAKNSKVAE